MSHKSDRVRVFLFSDFPKKNNGSHVEINFDKKDIEQNIDDAIAFLKSKKKLCKEIRIDMSEFAGNYNLQEVEVVIKKMKKKVKDVLKCQSKKK